MAVINYFEGNPLFNAGVGATCTMEGTFELDAAIMEGKDLSAGAVAGAEELPADVMSAIRNGDYNAVQSALVAALKGKEITPQSADVLQMAMLLEVIRTTDAGVMTTFAAESDKKKKFLAEFATDADWQELYLGCGLVPYHTDMGIDVLYRIWQEEKGKVKNKGLAVALASVWGGGETDPNPPIAKKNPSRYNPVWRYKFFQKNAKRKDITIYYTINSIILVGPMKMPYL